MTTPYVALAPRSLAPLVLTCEHASRRVPGGPWRGTAVRALLRSHWAWDLGGWRLTRELARQLGATAVGGRWSRLWIDLNRRVDDPDLVRAEAGGVVLPWNAHRTSAEVERRVASVHSPYHEEIDRQIARRLVRGVRPLILAVHTFTPVYRGRTRRFDVGVLYERDRAPARMLAAGVRAGGFSVRYNQPYSGMAGMMYAADRHGAHHRLPCLEIEVNQAVLDDPRRASRLAATVAAALTNRTAAKGTRKPGPLA